MKRILLDPLPAGGGAPAAIAPAPSKPAAPSPAPAAPAASPAPSAPASEPSDDPFQPPKKPDAAPAKHADNKGAPAPTDFDKLAPKELRERVKQLNSENQTFGGTIKSLEARIKELDGKGVDTTALTTRLTKLEKERDSAQAELRAARQEASPEFKEKFDKPFNQAAERARKQITELTVITNPEDGTTRPATWEDFAALYSLPVGKAIEQANALFGTSANFVLQQREKLLDLDQSRQTALEEEKAQFKERSAKEIADQTVKREGVSNFWREANKRLSETVEDYKSDATDTESSDARKHALSVFDESVNITDDASMQKKIIKDAHIRQKVGAYAVQKVVISRQKAEIESLKKQVDELKGSAPGDTQRGGGDAPNAPETDGDWEKAVIAEVKQRGS